MDDSFSWAAADPTLNLYDIIDGWDPVELQDLFITFLCSMTIPQRVQILSQTFLTTIKLGHFFLSDAKRIVLQRRVADSIELFSILLKPLETDNASPPPHAFGPMAPPFHLSPSPPSPPSFPVPPEQLFDYRAPRDEDSKECVADILASFTFFERLRVLTSALSTSIELAFTFSDGLDLAYVTSFISLLVPRLSILLRRLERINTPSPLPLPTDRDFGPITLAAHEAQQHAHPFTPALPLHRSIFDCFPPPPLHEPFH